MQPRSDQDSEQSNASILTALVAHESIRSFERGQPLFNSGEEPDGVHVLLSGEVDLLFVGRREDAEIRFNATGLILGLSSLVSGRPHEYTAVAESSVMTGFSTETRCSASSTRTPRSGSTSCASSASTSPPATTG